MRVSVLVIAVVGCGLGCAAGSVEESERGTQAASCGTPLAEVDGIWAKSNGSCQGTLCSCAGWIGTGEGYQCVELAQRYMHERFGIQTVWPVSYAQQMCDHQPSGVTTHWGLPSRDGYQPVHGDLVVFGGGTAGHVAVISEVWSDGASYVEQNSSPDGWGRLTGDPYSGYRRAAGPVKCFVHANSNDATAPPPEPPPPAPAPSGSASCDSLGYAGACAGAVSVYAQDGACKLRDCGAEGRACGYISSAEGWGCLGGTSGAQRYTCGDFGYEGRCLSNTLVWVEGGQCKTVSCGALGKRCDWDGSNGWNCVW